MPARRLREYDYSAPGAYFITICAYRRRQLFGSRAAADAIQASWDEIPMHLPVELDAFVVMPNHVHGILLLGRAGHARPLHVVVGSFKSAAARRINRLRRENGAPVWQRGYYDRVVRSERELEALRVYVVNNPAAWDSDPENRDTRARASAPWMQAPLRPGAF